MTRVRAKEGGKQDLCPLCRDAFGEEREVLRCPGCDVSYHLACCEELGGCSTLGCMWKGRRPPGATGKTWTPVREAPEEEVVEGLQWERIRRFALRGAITIGLVGALLGVILGGHADRSRGFQLGPGLQAALWSTPLGALYGALLGAVTGALGISREPLPLNDWGWMAWLGGWGIVLYQVSTGLELSPSGVVSLLLCAGLIVLPIGLWLLGVPQGERRRRF